MLVALSSCAPDAPPPISRRAPTPTAQMPPSSPSEAKAPTSKASTSTQESLKRAAEITRLHNPDGNERDYFGTAVAVHGNRLVIGAHGDDQAGKDFGATFLYEFDAKGKCQLIATFRAAGIKSHERYGTAVAIGREFVAVGASWSRPHSGTVYIYEPSTAGEWELTARLEAGGEDSPNQLFGGRLAVSGDLLLIGAEQHAKNRGGAFLF